jgi:hypothetical protein
MELCNALSVWPENYNVGHGMVYQLYSGMPDQVNFEHKQMKGGKVARESNSAASGKEVGGRATLQGGMVCMERVLVQKIHTVLDQNREG